MEDVLDISAVAEATGLTLRALRFYEARGLVSPLRTAGGRRVYGRGELARLNAAVALKRAGFSLAQIGKLLGGRTVDLGRLVALQLDALDAQAAQLTQARTLLSSVQSRIDRGEPIDVATLCSLIRQGDSIMESEKWEKVVDKYFDAGEQAEFKAQMAHVPAAFNQEEYSAKWRELGGRIEAALPLEPMSAAAQGFVDEWFALLKPFSQVATPAMWQGTSKMYSDMDNWPKGKDGAKPDMGFGKTVWEFIQTATQARIAAGGKVDGPAWMTGGAK